MTEKEYVSFLLLFILCVLGTAFKLWDYFRVRSAVKAERARVGSHTGRIVIKADWRAWLSTLLLLLGVLAPVVTGSILNPVPLAIFILFALAALYYFFHGLLWRVTLEEETFTCRTMTGKESTYRYDGVRRIVPMGKSKRKMDGTRLVMRDDTVVFIDRTLYGLETLERRVRDALGESFIEEASLNPIKPLR